MLCLLCRRRPRARKARPLRPPVWLTHDILEERTLPALSFTPVDFSALQNVRFHAFQPTCAALPAGDVGLGGVPFHIPTVGNDAWWAFLAPGPNPRVLDVPVSVAGAQEVHTLINTTFGLPGPNSYAALEVFGSGGAFYRKELFGNEDVRDFFVTTWTNWINNTTTTNVALGGNGPFNECRMDKQRVVLPERFLSETLTRVRVIDTGGEFIQNVILSGITVGARGPALVAGSLARSGTDGGVDVDFQVAEALLARPATVALYWASGPTPADRLGEPVFRTTVSGPPGTYGPFHVAPEAL